MNFDLLQKLNWELSVYGLFRAKAFLQPEAAKSIGIPFEGNGAFEWQTGLLQGELTHQVSWHSKGLDVPDKDTACPLSRHAFDGTELAVEIIFYLDRVA